MGGFTAIHSFKKSHFGQATSYELTHFKKMVPVHYYFV